MALCQECQAGFILHCSLNSKRCLICTVVLTNSAYLICQECSDYLNACEHCGKRVSWEDWFYARPMRLDDPRLSE